MSTSTRNLRFGRSTNCGISTTVRNRKLLVLVLDLSFMKNKKLKVIAQAINLTKTTDVGVRNLKLKQKVAMAVKKKKLFYNLENSLDNLF